MRCLVAITLIWFAAPSFAATFSCEQILAAVAAGPAPNVKVTRRDPEYGLVIALRDARPPMTLSQFKESAAQLTLYLIGNKSGADLAGNRFFSKKENKIDLETMMRHLVDGDDLLLRSSLEAEVQRNLDLLSYGGETSTQRKAAIDQSKHVIILNHQLNELQAKSVASLNADRSLDGVPTIWLVGLESGPALTPEASERADLIHYSGGGRIDFKLSKVETVYLGGGAIDQCLLQTLHGIAMQTTAPTVTVQISKSLSYLDAGREKPITLTAFLAQPPAMQKAFGEEAVTEAALMLKDDGFKLVKAPGTRAATLGMPLTFQHRSGRTIEVIYVD